jgi:hypothetical protein
MSSYFRGCQVAKENVKSWEVQKNKRSGMDGANELMDGAHRTGHTENNSLKWFNKKYIFYYDLFYYLKS